MLPNVAESQAMQLHRLPTRFSPSSLLRTSRRTCRSCWPHPSQSAQQSRPRRLSPGRRRLPERGTAAHGGRHRRQGPQLLPRRDGPHGAVLRALGLQGEGQSGPRGLPDVHLGGDGLRGRRHVQARRPATRSASPAWRHVSMPMCSAAARWRRENSSDPSTKKKVLVSDAGRRHHGLRPLPDPRHHAPRRQRHRARHPDARGQRQAAHRRP
jgi:hypothetical protein